jgi:hypothetical protein
MGWKDYEREVVEWFQEEHPLAKITADAHVLGRFSRVERQIDLLVEEQASDFSFRIVVDAKHRGRKIDVTEVEAFLGFLRDVEAHIGVMVALEGYTPAAISRAYYDESDLILDVLNLAELENYQSGVGVPYSGSHGVVVSAPFGWLVDGQSRGAALAWMYQRGKSLEEAVAGHEFAYVNFAAKDDRIRDLDSLCAHQEACIKASFPDAHFQYMEGARPQRVGACTRIRKLTTSGYAGPEFTGFADFDGFVFMCVVHSPKELEGKNLRKLRAVLRQVFPMSVKHERRTETGAE